MASPGFSALGVIALGGAVGAVMRYGVSLVAPSVPGDRIVSTLIVNFIGSLLLGIIIVAAAQMAPQWQFFRPFMATGVMGGFTTFSTAIQESFLLLVEGRWVLALLHLLVMIITCVGGVGLVLAISERSLRESKTGQEVPET